MPLSLAQVVGLSPIGGGRLAAVRPAAATNTIIATVPANKRWLFDVAMCNDAATTARVSLATLDNGEVIGDLADADWILNELDLQPTGVSSQAAQEGLVLTAGQSLVGLTDTAGVNFHVYGYEEDVG